MNKKYKKAVHIFRRDLRLQDNTALIYALKQSKEVIPCFIFDPKQIKKHPYQSAPGLQFMIESLEVLASELEKRGGTLYVFSRDPKTVIKELINSESIDLVTFNKDYTPFSLKRDSNIEELCNKEGIDSHICADTLLHEPGKVLKTDGTPYKVFTPYMRKAKTIDIPLPQKNTYKNYYHKKIENNCSTDFFNKILPERETTYKVLGGSTEAKKLVKAIKNLEHYKEQRDFPKEDYTSHLSAHHKFGTVSVRQVYYYAKATYDLNYGLITELYWRDFFTQIGYFFPHVFSGSFREMYDDINWSENNIYFKKWCEGRTGFPIVDAGMRELNKTGYMHNRVRMITASFLIKDLHIDWRWGEKYFAQKLLDYDPAVNNGNWQWVASTGCDAQPYFRIFNPWRQQQRFDKDCEYIKTWVPELAEVNPKDIHNIEKHGVPEGINYETAIINHKEAVVETKELYNEVRQKHQTGNV